MTDNMDEFEQDQFDASEPLDDGAAPTTKQGLGEMLRSKPVFKLVIIMGVVGLTVAGALGAFSGKPETTPSRLTAPPNLQQVAPGGAASPYFVEQNKLAYEQRVDEAVKQGGSVMPTPIGKPIDDNAFNKKDPLVEFRAETERMRQEFQAEREQNERRMQAMMQQAQQRQQQQMAPKQRDDSLAQAMQRQMQQMMDSWSPGKMKLVGGVTTPEEEERARLEKKEAASFAESASKQASALSANVAANEPKTIVPAGTVNYAQMLTEANSDVPGPIMVQILSGPLSGGRAIGSFRTMYEHLVLTFNLVSYKGKEYSINAIALNPDTTLGGMASEVDHRYFARVVLPAAASFMQAFGSALSGGQSQTVVSGDSVLVTEAEKGFDEAMFDGLGKAGETIGQFFQQEAQQTKTLVRVAAGTPMGLFFLQSVKDREPSVSNPLGTATPSIQNLLGGYGQQGQTGIYDPYMTMGSQPSVAGYGMNPSVYPPAAYSPYATTQGVGALGAMGPYSTTPGGTTRIYQGRL